jgi:hypothetical protein
MGYGDYSHEAHVAMTRQRASAPAAQVFHQGGCHPSMDPRGVDFRESRDSPDHPESLSVIFALDVSGSMGRIPHKLATETLPGFMKALLDAGVADPQVLFMAVGYAGRDRAPLQVGQFESTEALMDRWLTRMYLEGGGAGGDESYELAMYFAARHTKIDCYEKRGRRGYLIITGDEPPNLAVTRAHVQRVIGEALPADIPLMEMISETLRSYEIFYLIPDPGRGQQVGELWRAFLGERVIVLGDPDDTGYAAAGLVALTEGAVADAAALQQRLV